MCKPLALYEQVRKYVLLGSYPCYSFVEQALLLCAVDLCRRFFTGAVIWDLVNEQRRIFLSQLALNERGYRRSKRSNVPNSALLGQNIQRCYSEPHFYWGNSNDINNCYSRFCS